MFTLKFLLLLAIAISHVNGQAAQEAQQVVQLQVTEKPGRCTPMKLSKLSLCHQRYDLCQDDFQCPGDYKCCARPCGHVCQAPLNDTETSMIKMTSALARPQLTQVAITPEELALELMALQQPTKKTIDPYSYYYNQMTRNQNYKDLMNYYQNYNPYQSYNPSRTQLLNAQRYMPYNNRIMRTKAYNRNKMNRKNPMSEKVNKLSQRFRKPANYGKKAECDCEEKKNSGSTGNKVHKLSNRLHKKVQAPIDANNQDVESLKQEEIQTMPERIEKLSATKQAPVSDPLVEALPDQEPKQVKPLQTTEQAVFKPGVCPNKFTFGRCLIECYQDSDCEGNKICCHSGCGYSCAIPMPEKRTPGQCPNNKNRIFKCTSPKPSCMRDRDCAYDEKCCSIGCQYTCMKV